MSITVQMSQQAIQDLQAVVADAKNNPNSKYKHLLIPESTMKVTPIEPKGDEGSEDFSITY